MTLTLTKSDYATNTRLKTMIVAVILNKHAGIKSGNEITAEKLKSFFGQKNIDSKIFEVTGETIADTAKSLIDSDVDAVVVAGGDGTISNVAGILAGTGKKLAVVPRGTFNHFAKDLNIPLDPEAAIQVIAEGHAVAIDVAEVNGKVFINNSSVGLYPKAVRQREKFFHRFGGNKILAMFIGSLSIFSRFPLLTVNLESGKSRIKRTTPFVFIGNNEYMLDLFNLGMRKELNRGRLCLYTANCKKRWSIFRFAFWALINRIEKEKDFDLKLVRGFRLDTPKRKIRVALDGEVIRMKPPLHYKIRPGDLQVIVPGQPKKEDLEQ